jgi:hypothetical protein
MNRERRSFVGATGPSDAGCLDAESVMCVLRSATAAHHPHHSEHAQRTGEHADTYEESCHRVTYVTGAQLVPASFDR